MLNRVKVMVCGKEYMLQTEEAPSYVYGLAKMLDKKINDIEIWNAFAKKHHLRTTVGSDFHNQDGIRPVIGLLNEDLKDMNASEILENLCKE